MFWAPTGERATIRGVAGQASALDRKSFIADPTVLSELGLGLDDLGDSDVRALVIRSEHPEFEEALRSGWRAVDLGRGPMNPRLHLTMHEVVATQLWEDSPPEVWETAGRLLEAGYERHEILHMLSQPVSKQVWAAMHEQRPYDLAAHLAALRALPESWERERSATTAEKRHESERKRVRRQARAARRRNRRPH